MYQTQWPDWVYKQFDANHLASQIVTKVKMLCKALLILILNVLYTHKVIFFFIMI